MKLRIHLTSLTFAAVDGHGKVQATFSLPPEGADHQNIIEQACEGVDHPEKIREVSLCPELLLVLMALH